MGIILKKIKNEVLNDVLTPLSDNDIDVLLEQTFPLLSSDSYSLYHDKVFTTSYNFKPNKLYLTYNGQYLIKDIDFEVWSNNTVFFKYVIPSPDTEVITATYEVG